MFHLVLFGDLEFVRFLLIRSIILTVLTDLAVLVTEMMVTDFKLVRIP